MTATIVFGPLPAGSTGTVTLLSNQTYIPESLTVHIFKGRKYYTVVRL